MTAVPRKTQKEEVSVRGGRLEGSGTGAMSGWRSRGGGEGIWGTQPRSLGRRGGVEATQEQNMWRTPRERKRKRVKKIKIKDPTVEKKKPKKFAKCPWGESIWLPSKKASEPALWTKGNSLFGLHIETLSKYRFISLLP